MVLQEVHVFRHLESRYHQHRAEWFGELGCRYGPLEGSQELPLRVLRVHVRRQLAGVRCIRVIRGPETTSLGWAEQYPVGAPSPIMQFNGEANASHETRYSRTMVARSGVRTAQWFLRSTFDPSPFFDPGLYLLNRSATVSYTHLTLPTTPYV